MSESVLIGITLVLVLGVSAQWLAWRLKLPSILFLLIAGFLAGPITHVIDPDALFGDLLFPMVSLSVAIILFEGALQLRVAEVAKLGRAVVMLTTVGVGITWALTALAANRLVGLAWPLAVLFGALHTVTGPTVIGPLLRQVRPTGPAASLLKWEGILTDPIGALLAVLAFQVIEAGRFESAPLEVALGVAHGIGAGLLVGAVAAAMLYVLLRRHMVPDHLQSPFSLMMVVATWAAANRMHPESGLIAVTVLGMLLANQKRVDIRPIAEFKENLQVLLLAVLFIVLSARMSFDELESLGPGALLFLAALVLVVRPACVYLSTIGSGLTWGSRTFVAAVAPRGIVAAAVASVLGLRLIAAKVPDAEALAPLMFLTIIGTVTIYGLTTAPMARRLGLSHRDPQGVFIVGAHPFGRALAQALKQRGFTVLLADSNRRNVLLARMEGLSAWHGNALSENAHEELELGGISRLLALTPNDEANSLLTLHFAHVFGRSQVFQLAPARASTKAGAPASAQLSSETRGRVLFSSEASYARLEGLLASGNVLRGTTITDKFPWKTFVEQAGGSVIPLFVITGDKKLAPVTAESPPQPSVGQTVLSLAPPPPRDERPAGNGAATAEASASAADAAGSAGATSAPGTKGASSSTGA